MKRLPVFMRCFSIAPNGFYISYGFWVKAKIHLGQMYQAFMACFYFSLPLIDTKDKGKT
jgi:hypothetical protein